MTAENPSRCKVVDGSLDLIRRRFLYPKGIANFVFRKTKIDDITMANLRKLKKEIDYCLEEVVFDCDMAMYFQP